MKTPTLQSHQSSDKKSSTRATEAVATIAAKLLHNAAALNEITGNAVDVGSAPKDLVYEDGKLKLYRLRRDTPATCSTPVLLVYALVNRPYMLDLQPDRSLIRNFLDNGLDVYLIDWGYPSKADRYVTIDDYVNGYIDDCVSHILCETGFANLNLVGICQGGTLSTIYAALHPEKVRTLVPIATPIDFSTNDALLFQWAKTLNIDALVDGFGVVPESFMNAGFMLVKPFARLEKYAAALDFHDAPEKLHNFLRMEQWIFDSPAQAGECLRQFVKDLYQGNKLVHGTLQVGNKTASLRNITAPLLNVYATHDHIVSPSATLPLNDCVSSTDKALCAVQGGHIGIFVGARAQRELAPTIATWLKERDVRTTPSRGAKAMTKNAKKATLKTPLKPTSKSASAKTATPATKPPAKRTTSAKE